jgi:hypothetical protein
MKSALKAFGLLLLLLVAQQGAVVHELSHLSHTDGAALKVDSGAAVDTTCALCPAFAQVVTPAFSHSFHVPLLGRAAAQRTQEPQFSAVDAAVPQPRSRGPPSLS